MRPTGRDIRGPGACLHRHTASRVSRSASYTGYVFAFSLWATVLFDSSASHSFIVASVVIELGLEVETLEEPLYVSSPQGIRARIGMVCRGCELEISGTLLTVDLRIMDMLEFDVILGMDWLTAYRVVIDCERRRVTAYTQDGTRVVFQGGQT